MAIITLRPEAAGDETSIPGQIPDSGEHWQKVDEVVADDNDYVINSTEDGIYYRDLYALSYSTTAGRINKIIVHFRAKSTTLGRIKPSLKSNSTVTDGTEVNLINAWTNYSQEWTTNPADGEAWDWSDIDSLQVGISLKDFETQAACFAGNTRITLSDRSYKEVKDIRLGDKVAYYDFVEHKIKSTIVTKVNEHPIDEMEPYYLVLNKKLKVTSNHPLDKIDGTMITAGKIKIGDFLQGEIGSVEIFSIKKVWKRVKTYSLETKSKRYFIDGFSDMTKPHTTYCSQVYVEVDYLPVVVTTYDPTDIIRADSTKVTVNGLIEVDGAGDITTRGFKYGFEEPYDSDESETGTYGGGTFSLQLTGLTADTIYYVRAYAVGPWGTIYGSYVEFRTAYPYGSAKIEIKAEATATDFEIDAIGGKRSLTISNHLIQTQALAKSIANNYLAEYKDQKTKLVVTRPTPAPYEIGDTIIRDIDDGKLPYYYLTSALISYASVADAEHYYTMVKKKDMIIRKLNVSFSAGNYVSVLELED